MNSPAPPDPEARCETCGQVGAFEFSIGTRCLDCYEAAGSCGGGGGDEED